MFWHLDFGHSFGIWNLSLGFYVMSLAQYFRFTIIVCISSIALLLTMGFFVAHAQEEEPEGEEAEEEEELQLLPARPMILHP